MSAKELAREVVSILRGDRLSHRTKAILCALAGAALLALSGWLFVTGIRPAAAPAMERTSVALPAWIDAAEADAAAAGVPLQLTAPDGCHHYVRVPGGEIFWVAAPGEAPTQ